MRAWELLGWLFPVCRAIPARACFWAPVPWVDTGDNLTGLDRLVVDTHG